MSTMRLEIVTPERTVYSEDIMQLVARTTTGDIGVLPKHAPLVATLVPGVLHVKLSESQDNWFAVSGGFVEVTPEKVTILARTAEPASEIDVERAEAAKRRAEGLLRDERNPDIDVDRAQAAFDRAAARLKAVQKWI